MNDQVHIPTFAINRTERDKLRKRRQHAKLDIQLKVKTKIYDKKVAKYKLRGSFRKIDRKAKDKLRQDCEKSSK